MWNIPPTLRSIRRCRSQTRSSGPRPSRTPHATTSPPSIFIGRHSRSSESNRHRPRPADLPRVSRRPRPRPRPRPHRRPHLHPHSRHHSALHGVCHHRRRHPPCRPVSIPTASDACSAHHRHRPLPSRAHCRQALLHSHPACPRQRWILLGHVPADGQPSTTSVAMVPTWVLLRRSGTLACSQRARTRTTSWSPRTARSSATSPTPMMGTPGAAGGWVPLLSARAPWLTSRSGSRAAPARVPTSRPVSSSRYSTSTAITTSA